VRSDVTVPLGPLVGAAGLESGLGRAGGVLVWEPAVSLAVLTLPGRRWWLPSVGLEAALVVHRWWFEGDSGGCLDGRFALPLWVRVGATRVVVALLPYLRLDHIRHLLGERVLYESRTLGLLVTAGAKLF
jgi:hypothetical protein